jgi:polysaccharide export outer membrane protein
MPLVLWLGAIAGCAGRTAQHPSPVVVPDIAPDETLGVDDVFEVRVIGESDLSAIYRIGSDGAMDFPYVGHVEAAGMRPAELQKLLVAKLRDGYLVSPQVSVTIKEWNSRRVSVLGQVNKPGKVDYYPRMTIMDAIAAAGGFTAVAAQNSVKLRRDINGRAQSTTFRVGDINEGRAPNVMLLPRDVLFVDERIF